MHVGTELRLLHVLEYKILQLNYFQGDCCQSVFLSICVRGEGLGRETRRDWYGNRLGLDRVRQARDQTPSRGCHNYAFRLPTRWSIAHRKSWVSHMEKFDFISKSLSLDESHGFSNKGICVSVICYHC